MRGIEAIPDYDEQAQSLRDRVQPMLPDPLPAPLPACVSMLDAARQYYDDTEGIYASSTKTMVATRSKDLADCQTHTSPAAAACVAVLMTKREGEFPWVLDQCSRAFPRSGTQGS